MKESLVAQKFSNYWQFASPEVRKDVEATIQGSKLFIEHYVVYLQRKASELDKQILDRATIESNNWTDKLATILGERRAYETEIKLLKDFLSNTY